MDEDFTAQDYRLQHRRAGSGGRDYEDSYIGRDCEFLVLHLDPHIDYLFRVCARGEGRTEWSPWSIPQTGCTTLIPHGRHRFIITSLSLCETCVQIVLFNRITLSVLNQSPWPCRSTRVYFSFWVESQGELINWTTCVSHYW